MAFIDKKDPVVLNIKLTSKGRELLAAGNLKFKYFAIGDSEIDYNFNAETSHIVAESDILRPLDNNPNILSFITKEVSGDPYNALPAGINSQYLVVNSTESNGFFTNITNNEFTFITDGNHVKQPDIQIDMATGVDVANNRLTLLKSPTYGTSGAEPAVGDTLLVKWTLNGNTTSYISNKNQPTPYLVYQIISIISGSLAANNLIVEIDRKPPSLIGATGIAGALVYKPTIDFSGDTLFNYSPDYLDESVLAFLQNSQCPTVVFPFWNMSIVFTEEIAGVQVGNKTYGQFDSHPYAGFVSYIQNQAPYYKKLGIIHYTNSSPANVYAEGFYLNTAKLIIPTIMWHKSSGSTLGATFIAGNGYSLSGLSAHYYDLVDATNPAAIVGKIFDELKLFVIEDPELLFAMSYKSNRSWTLPMPIAAAGGGCAEVAPIYSLKTYVGTPGSIQNTGGYDITEYLTVTEYGMQFKKLSESTWSKTIRGNSLTVNHFETSMGGLEGNTQYEYRAYAIWNGVNEMYGDTLTITTPPTPPVPVAPTVSLNAIVDVTQTTAGGISSIISTGGAPITVSGVVWGTSSNPTIAGSKSTDGTGTAGSIFTGHLVGLVAGTLYYVRAYATNSVDTAYSSELSFTTVAPTSTPPTVTTTAPAAGQLSATGGGNVTNEGTASVTAKGVVWSTSPSPTTALSTKTNDGTGVGAYSSTLTPLLAGTLYYVRAYAISSVGTSYGSELSFTTTAAPVAPTVTTGTVIVSDSYNASIQASIVSDDGGAALLERGIVWSLSNPPSMPTDIACSNSDGLTTLHSSFNLSMSSEDFPTLEPDTTYYVRAYACNNAQPVGLIGYGLSCTVTTPPPPATPIVINFYNQGSAYWCKDGFFNFVPPLPAGESVQITVDMSTKWITDGFSGGASVVAILCCTGDEIFVQSNNYTYCTAGQNTLTVNAGDCYCYFVSSTAGGGSEAIIRLNYLNSWTSGINPSISTSSCCISINI
jgi:hypothetical protein